MVPGWYLSSKLMGNIFLSIVKIIIIFIKSHQFLIFNIVLSYFILKKYHRMLQ